MQKRKVQILDHLPDLSAVIVADDDAMIRSVLRSKLEAIDQPVFLASNGVEAVELASRLRAKLILLDLKMPRLDGLRACQRIRKMAHNTDTPIVILTAIFGADAQAAAARVGATAFLAKPFRSGELMRALSPFLTISDATRNGINCVADRVAEIARTSPVPNGRVAEEPVRSGSRLDRDKDILTILRR